jgi:hypothetical protein
VWIGAKESEGSANERASVPHVLQIALDKGRDSQPLCRQLSRDVGGTESAASKHYPISKSFPRSFRQAAQQVCSARKRDVEQIDSIAHTDPTKVRVARKDGVMQHDQPFALDGSTIKVSSEDAVLYQQTGVEISLFEMGCHDATIDQLHHIVERTSRQIQPIQNAVAHDDGLVDPPHILSAKPATHDQWVWVQHTSDPHIMDHLASAQAFNYLSCWRNLHGSYRRHTNSIRHLCSSVCFNLVTEMWNGHCRIAAHSLDRLHRLRYPFICLQCPLGALERL